MQKRIAQDPLEELGDAGLAELEDIAKEQEVPGEPVPAPDESEMVKEISEHPSTKWREYLQPIIRAIKAQLGGVPVSLVDPDISNDYVSPQFGFNITGYINFPKGRPDDVRSEFGDSPIRFEVYIGPPDYDIHYPVELYSAEDVVNSI